MVEVTRNGSAHHFRKVAERAVYDFSKALRESKNVSDTCDAQVLSALGASWPTALLG